MLVPVINQNTPTEQINVPVPTPVQSQPKQQQTPRRRPIQAPQLKRPRHAPLSFGGEMDAMGNRVQGVSAVILPWSPPHPQRMSRPKRYSADHETTKNLLDNLTYHELLNLPTGDKIRRLVTADALEDNGRHDEASLLRSNKPVWVREGKIESAEVKSRVAKPKGSWKYQDAHDIVWYTPQRRRDGGWSWMPSRRLGGKYSEPQLRRMGHGDAIPGSIRGPLLHHELDYLRIPHNERGRRYQPPQPPQPHVPNPDTTDEHGLPIAMSRKRIVVRYARPHLTTTQKDRAKKVELVVLPKSIEGKKCGSCTYGKRHGENGLYCTNNAVHMNVKSNWACKLWEGKGVKKLQRKKILIQKAT